MSLRISGNYRKIDLWTVSFCGSCVFHDIRVFCLPYQFDDGRKKATKKDKTYCIIANWYGDSLLDLAFDTARNHRGGVTGSVKWLSETLSIGKLLQFILFQTTPIGDVSWFMVALILCYVFTFEIARYNLWTVTTYLIPVLLTVNIIIGEILPFAGVSVQWYWCSNLWVLGFPFYAMGYWIKMNRERITDKATNSTLIILAIVSLIAVTGERLFTAASQLFVGNILCAFTLFCFCIKNPDRFKKTSFVEWLGDSAFYVYILHPIVRDVYDMSIVVLIKTPVIMWVRPLVVFAVCLLSAWLAGTIRSNYRLIYSMWKMDMSGGN